MEPGARDLAGRPQTGKGRSPVRVDRHAADHVVGPGTDRDRVAGDVEIEVAAKPIDPRKAAPDCLGIEVREVEIDVGVLGLGHLGGDRQRDVVARRQLGERMVSRHEPLAKPVAQIGPFAAQGFGQEMACRAGDVEHGGMELHEFHVTQLGARAIGHRVAVAGGDGRVGRLAKELAGAAGRQHDGPGPDQGEPAAAIPDQDAPALSFVRHQVDRDAVLPDADIAPGSCLRG